MENPFFSTVTNKVQVELNKRVKHYSEDVRTQEDLDWTYRKIPYCEVQSGPTILGTPNSGSFDTMYHQDKTITDVQILPKPILTKLTITNEGRYGSLRKATVDFTVFLKSDLDEYTETFLMPGRHVTIRYGWSDKAADSNVDKINNGVLRGTVYNFNYSLRPQEGGYDCSFDIMGKGFFAIGANANSKGQQTTTIKVQATGNPKNLIYSGMQARLYHDLKDLISTLGGSPPNNHNVKHITWLNGTGGSIINCGYTVSTGAEIINDDSQEETSYNNLHKPSQGQPDTLLYFSNIIPQDTKQWDKEVKDKRDKEPEEGLDAILYEDSKIYYVNLKYITDILINNTIREAFGKTNDMKDIFGQSNNAFYVKCDRDVSTSVIPAGNRDYQLVSADPSTVFFPGHPHSYYGSNVSFPVNTSILYNGSGEYINILGTPPAHQFQWKENINYTIKGYTGWVNYADSSKIFINVETIDGILRKYEKEEFFPFTKFLEEIFKEINHASGGAIQLVTIINDEKTNSGDQVKYLEVRDRGNTECIRSDGTSFKAKPYEFKAFSKDSILKNISMDSKLPSKMATAMYIGGGSSLTGTDQSVAEFFGKQGPGAKPTDSSGGGGRNLAWWHALQNQGYEIEFRITLNNTTKGTYAHLSAATAKYNKFISANLQVQLWAYAYDMSIGATLKQQNPTYKALVKPNSGRLMWHGGAQQYVYQHLNKVKADITAGRAVSGVALGDLASIKDIIDAIGPQKDIVEGTISGLRKYCRDGSTAAYMPWNNRVMLPISLGITLDGIEGFRFGNLITTDWLPSKYLDITSDPKVSFCVTNITHTITPENWETELETQCRLK
jgi:hypothetical protein